MEDGRLVKTAVQQMFGNRKVVNLSTWLLMNVPSDGINVTRDVQPGDRRERVGSSEEVEKIKTTVYIGSKTTSENQVGGNRKRYKKSTSEKTKTVRTAMANNGGKERSEARSTGASTKRCDDIMGLR